jgi:predicted amidophosphoribosyltransferase
MPTDPTAADRMRRWRQRQQAGTPWQPLVCAACPRNSSGKHGPLCCRCWERLTPEGRKVRAKRLRESRARRRQGDNL